MTQEAFQLILRHGSAADIIQAVIDNEFAKVETMATDPDVHGAVVDHAIMSAQHTRDVLERVLYWIERSEQDEEFEVDFKEVLRLFNGEPEPDVVLSGPVQRGRGKQEIHWFKYDQGLASHRRHDNRGRRHAENIRLKKAVLSGELDNIEPLLRPAA
jgi:hypothetical protein